jgi:Uma2 family endonuclease
MSAQPKPYYTPEQYLELEQDAEYKSEYLSGQIFAMAGGSPEHSAIGNNIGREMGNLLKRGPCEVFNSDLRVTVMQTGLMTYPDVTVICGEQHRHPLDRHSLINPTVLFEVFSPMTEADDRGEKWAHYRRLDSLQEYILVSQDKPLVEQYVRQDDGSWKFTAVEGLAASLFLPSLGSSLPLSEVYDKVTFSDL